MVQRWPYGSKLSGIIPISHEQLDIKIEYTRKNKGSTL